MWQQVDFPCSTERLHNHEQITIPIVNGLYKGKKAGVWNDKYVSLERRLENETILYLIVSIWEVFNTENNF